MFVFRFQGFENKTNNETQAELLTLGGRHVHQLLHAVRALQLDVILLLVPDFSDAPQQGLKSGPTICILRWEVGSSQEGLEVRRYEA